MALASQLLCPHVGTQRLLWRGYAARLWSVRASGHYDFPSRTTRLLLAADCSAPVHAALPSSGRLVRLPSSFRRQPRLPRGSRGLVEALPGREPLTTAAGGETAAALPVPWRERDPCACVRVAELAAWAEEKRRQTDAVARAWRRQEEEERRRAGGAGAMQAGGEVSEAYVPTAEDLQLELRWLLEDAVAGWQLKGRCECGWLEAAAGAEGQGEEASCASAPGSQWCPHCFLPADWQAVEQLGEQQRSADRRGGRAGSGRGTPFAQDGLARAEGIAAVLRVPFAELQAAWQQQRVGRRVPLQYVTQGAWWRELLLAVSPAVLVPRPETELLVELMAQAEEERRAAEAERRAEAEANAWRSAAFNSAGAREAGERGGGGPSLDSLPWVDLGTGSGALAIAAAQWLEEQRGSASPPSSSSSGSGGPEPLVFAVDSSAEACAVAAANVRRYGLQASVRVLHGDWFAPLAALQPPPLLAGLLSNPPYIPSRLLPSLQKEVRLHEPQLALDGGEGDGLQAFRAILAQAPKFLAPGGLVVLETHGHGQAAQVAALMEGCGRPQQPAFAAVRVHRDYSGVERFVTGRVAGSTASNL